MRLIGIHISNIVRRYGVRLYATYGVYASLFYEQQGEMNYCNYIRKKI